MSHTSSVGRILQPKTHSVFRIEYCIFEVGLSLNFFFLDLVYLDVVLGQGPMVRRYMSLNLSSLPIRLGIFHTMNWSQGRINSTHLPLLFTNIYICSFVQTASHLTAVMVRVCDSQLTVSRCRLSFKNHTFSALLRRVGGGSSLDKIGPPRLALSFWESLCGGL
jgi:hypothetical protein